MIPILDLEDGPATGTYIVQTAGTPPRFCVVRRVVDFREAMWACEIYFGRPCIAAMGIVGAELCPKGSGYRVVADWYRKETL